MQEVAMLEDQHGAIPVPEDFDARLLPGGLVSSRKREDSRAFDRGMIGLLERATVE